LQKELSLEAKEDAFQTLLMCSNVVGRRNNQIAEVKSFVARRGAKNLQRVLVMKGAASKSLDARRNSLPYKSPFNSELGGYLLKRLPRQINDLLI